MRQIGSVAALLLILHLSKGYGTLGKSPHVGTSILKQHSCERAQSLLGLSAFVMVTHLLQPLKWQLSGPVPWVISISAATQSSFYRVMGGFDKTPSIGRALG